MYFVVTLAATTTTSNSVRVFLPSSYIRVYQGRYIPLRTTATTVTFLCLYDKRHRFLHDDRAQIVTCRYYTTKYLQQYTPIHTTSSLGSKEQHYPRTVQTATVLLITHDVSCSLSQIPNGTYIRVLYAQISSNRQPRTSHRELRMCCKL